MKKDDVLGLALGTLMGTYVVVGNVLRGDPHLVSVFPDGVGFAIVPVFLSVALVWAARHGGERASLQRSGRRISALGAIVFASILAGFAVMWFSHASPGLVLFGSAGAFLLTLALGALTTWLCSRAVPRAA